MADFETRVVIKAFLASPGDLADERRRAKDVVDEVNRTVGRTWGITIELLGWEDTLPGTGRPQEIINRDVDSCDLFIGMLWRRWGEPTGEYSSGFEEEFGRARSRRQGAAKPEIWLAFKRVDPEQLQDPGEQLRKVLAFQGVQKAARELLYKEFTDPDDWNRQLREWLSTFVSEQAKRQVQALIPTVSQESAPASATGGTPVPTVPESREPLPAQMGELGARLAEVLSQKDIDSYAESIANLEDFEITRLQLFSKSLISALHTHEFLSVHETNLLYRFRTLVELVPPEGTLLFRTIVSDADDLRPGWFWFSTEGVEELTGRLLTTARNDSDFSARQRAIALLKLGGMHPAPEQRGAVFAELLQDQTDVVKIEALDYLADLDGEELLPVLEQLAATGSSLIASKAAAARILILARLDPGRALEQAATNVGPVPHEVVDYLEQQLRAVHKDALTAALSSRDARVRRIVAQQLLARHEITEPVARELLKDESVVVREVAFRALLQLGVPPAPEEVYDRLKPPQGQTSLLAALTTREEAVEPDEIVLDIYQSFALDRIEADIDWFSLKGEPAYRALALRFFEQRSDQIRSDLRDGFDRIKEMSVARFRAQFGDAAETALRQWAYLDEFVRSRFAAAALAGVAASGQPGDAELARLYLPRGRADIRYDDQALQAIRVLERFGSADDVERLIELASVAFGKVKQSAGQAALALSGNTFAASRRLLETQDPILVGLAVQALWEQPSNAVTELLYPCLHSEREATRVRAAAYFAHRRTTEQLKELLDTYVGESAYYYNVVCWLDRILYAPEPLREAYMKRLKNELTLD